MNYSLERREYIIRRLNSSIIYSKYAHILCDSRIASSIGYRTTFIMFENHLCAKVVFDLISND
jgi:hypothetical protein